MRATSALILASLQAISVGAVYLPLKEYSGATFFDGWDFYGNVDNTTWGNVSYVTREVAVAEGLAFLNNENRAVIKVDNTTFIPKATLVNRKTVRLETKDRFGSGSLWIIDVHHTATGCSQWPAFWSSGDLWPDQGEIDIIEAINLMDNNQMALHTLDGCTKPEGVSQSGTDLWHDCSSSRGCIVKENKANSFGPGFNSAGGGVFVTQWDVSGLFMWFFPRSDIPDNIKNADSKSTMDVSTWGLPTAAYPASTCDMSKFFGPQKLILLTTLCGVWAGSPNSYDKQCITPEKPTCQDMVWGDGSVYSEAYWEVSYVRTYYLEGTTPIPLVETSNDVTPSLSATSEPEEGTTRRNAPSLPTDAPNQPPSGSVANSAGFFGILSSVFFAVLSGLAL